MRDPFSKIAARVALAPIGRAGTRAVRLPQATDTWPNPAAWFDGIKAVGEHRAKTRI